jgi:uroporphyrinogen decarboxylase
MSEYRALREKYTILEMIKTPDLAADVTMQPLEAFDLDAGIIFADILPVLEPMGLQLEFVQGEGPLIHNPVRSAADVDGLRLEPAEEALGFTLDAIRKVQAELAGRIPLIGFSGAPFTLVSYAVEGGASRNYTTTKGLMYEQPKVWHRLMGKVSEAVGDYLAAQVRAGADAVQLFDSWAGALSPADYSEYVLPYSARAIETAKAEGDVPAIHFGTGTSGYLDLLKQAGGDVIGVDWRADLDQAWAGLGDDVAVQGNLDPVVLFGPVEEIRRQAGRILDSVQGKPGHIFNLGHGILQHTPVDHVAALVDFVHEHTGGSGAS